LLIRGHLDLGDAGAGSGGMGPFHVEVDLAIPASTQGATGRGTQVVDVEGRIVYREVVRACEAHEARFSISVRLQKSPRPDRRHPQGGLEGPSPP
jgi:hypothetical protein